MSSNSVCNHTCDKQIRLPLRGRPILLSLVWLQTELDSTQSYYHYLLSVSARPVFKIFWTRLTSTGVVPISCTHRSYLVYFLLWGRFLNLSDCRANNYHFTFMVGLLTLTLNLVTHAKRGQNDKKLLTVSLCYNLLRYCSLQIHSTQVPEIWKHLAECFFFMYQ